MRVSPVVVLSLLAANDVGAVDPFNWQPCPDNKKDPLLQCGYLTVPLDYANNVAANHTIDIAVRRYRTKFPSPQGTIIINPGGPGNAGTPMATASYVALTGGQYDVLGFDPRGVGLSHPIACTKNGFTGAQEAARLAAKSVPFDVDSSETSVSRFGAEFNVKVQRCHVYDGDLLPYLSTALVARDMDAIRAALGESVLHFLGYSYGSLLGATYANLFPDRVGRMALDSVLDPTEYTGSPRWIPRTLVDIDQVFEGFASTCEAAGPKQCPLAAIVANGTSVASAVRNFLAEASDTPLILPAVNDFALLSGADIRTTLFGYMYSPSTWPQAAKYLAQLMQGKAMANPIVDACPKQPSTYRGVNMEFAMYAANDGDSVNFDDQDWTRLFRKAKDVSSLFGPIWVASRLAMKYWTTRPVERYDGPWDASLRQPVLLLQNQVDPITPLRGAEHLADLMGKNAVLVTRDGYGHTTINLPSNCMQSLLIAFFNDGTYPDANTNCAVDAQPFSAHAVENATAPAILTRDVGASSGKHNAGVDPIQAAREAAATLLSDTLAGF
ncbi:Aste57867_3251 [Aphanomyces stellatus]|uniref:Aste57867_3251 protein n=1 Tax=Aphanomyces stellatus TaxID=120398 RepID=A0A485K9A0_9STRA|nr:hypothetical protein As57867_003241 [Aphanomyces stellatus]VFT80424.1 Aste57867_3251 [Aphanomyces stellatus]